MKFCTHFFFLCILFFQSMHAKQPNPPEWPPSSISDGGVFVFDPADPEIQLVVNRIFTINGGQTDNGQFSPNRYALLFKPGNYPILTVPVGYYTSVIGLRYGNF